GNVLTVGFEQLLLQQPAVGAGAAQVIDTFVYFRGIAGGDWGVSTAVGLVKGVIGTVLELGADRLAKRLGTEGLFCWLLHAVPGGRRLDRSPGTSNRWWTS